MTKALMLLQILERQKPHLTKSDGLRECLMLRGLSDVWLCLGQGAIAQGETYQAAYDRWDVIRPKREAA